MMQWLTNETVMSGSPPQARHILVLTGRISLLVVSLANIWPQVDWRLERGETVSFITETEIGDGGDVVR